MDDANSDAASGEGGPREAIARHAAASRRSAIFITRWDADLTELRYLNRARVGGDPAALLGRPLASWTGREVAERARASASRAIETGELVRATVPLRDGATVYEGVIAAVARGEGAEVCAIATRVTGPQPAPEAARGQRATTAAWPPLRAAGDRAIVEAIDRAHRRIGRDLHDDLGQQLTGVALLLEGLASRLTRAAPTEVAAVRQLQDLVAAAQERARLAVRTEAASTAQTQGLRAALDELAAYASSVFGVRCRLAPSPTPTPLDGATATHLYRVAQEAVTNAARHGRAREIVIRVEAHGRDLALLIEDDGAGFDVDAATGAGGMGLLIMRWRAEQLGGTLTVTSTPGAGTRVRCLVPR